MTISFVDSHWKAGNLVFEEKATATPIFTIAPQGVREAMTVTDIDTQNGTLTAAAIAGGIIVHTSNTGAGTLTTDTAANIIAAFPGIHVGEVVKAYLINDGDQTDTLAAGNSVTLGDAGQTIATNEAALLLFLVTSSTTVTLYHLGA